MSINNHYTILYGYCVNEKFKQINDIENSEEKYWDGIPEFSLNYGNNKAGYKIVKDCLGKEELYFGVELISFDEYFDSKSHCFEIDEIKHKYIHEINNKYYHLFKEVPEKELQICFVCECI